MSAICGNANRAAPLNKNLGIALIIQAVLIYLALCRSIATLQHIIQNKCKHRHMLYIKRRFFLLAESILLHLYDTSRCHKPYSVMPTAGCHWEYGLFVLDYSRMFASGVLHPPMRDARRRECLVHMVCLLMPTDAH